MSVAPVAGKGADGRGSCSCGSESKARALVRLFEELGGERAAETHYLVMLLEYIDASATPSSADLQRALQVRLLAEEAALGLPREEERAGAAVEGVDGDGQRPRRGLRRLGAHRRL